jgi:L-asparaginase II
MLATCVHLGLPIDGYLDPRHPLQQRVLSVVVALTRMPTAEILTATDGCSLPTFGASIRAFATAYATIASPGKAATGQGREHAEALLRLRAAMTRHPENVAGHDSLVTDLMRFSQGAIVAKSGAEGLLCLAVPDHEIGIAIKVLDGSFRAHAVVACQVLAELGLVPQEVTRAILDRHDPRLSNHNERHVGDLRPAFALERQHIK